FRETRRNKAFWDQYRKAELASALTPLRTIQNAAHSNWRAATWLLERKLPQNFAATHRRMIDPTDFDEVLQRIMDAIESAIPDSDLCIKIMRRISLAMRTEIHEATTNRKNPKTFGPKRRPQSVSYQDPFDDYTSDSTFSSPSSPPESNP